MAAIASCVLGLLEHPEVLLKAQKQLDEVCGWAQVPDFEHYDALPYITAITKETLRWRDVLPMGKSLLFSFSPMDMTPLPFSSQLFPICWRPMMNSEGTAFPRAPLSSAMHGKNYPSLCAALLITVTTTGLCSTTPKSTLSHSNSSQNGS